MLPRLGELNGVETEIVSKPREEFQAEAYRSLGLPTAPGIMIDDRVLISGGFLEEDRILAAVRERLDAKGSTQGGN
ncbi:hypothetical protein C6366_09790 [Desulfonatronum sp. SC1]|nr:hypothetical protein [Desulfonatronum sp. SC1]PTN36346.1 hypothetical protein C6366_09790 [Desulfonatronum sp. SC1]